MKDSPFSRFIQLVSIDKKIQSIVAKKATVEKMIDDFNKQEKDQEKVLEQARQKILQLKKNVDFQELEMKALDSKEEEKKNTLASLSDYRECQALKNEIDGIHRLQVAQEKIILDAWAQLEEAQAVYKKQELECTSLREKSVQDVSLIKNNELTISRELADLKEEREKMLVGIPAEWLEKYELMGKRIDNPVVPIEQQSCGGCYQQLISQDIIRARHGALMQCKKCFRLMYLAEMIN
jgi:predicted  nucleic acid-binding Zn-ribbon protein